MSEHKLPRRQFLRTLSAGAIGAGALPALAGTHRAFAARIRSTGRAVAQHNFAGLRNEYRLAPHITYFNHGSIGTIPGVVLESYKAYLDVCETNPHQYIWGAPWAEAREETRAKAAAFVGCAPEEIAFTHNTTEGFNTLASGLPLGPGDEVVFSSMNHPGASICWHHYARQRGFSVKRFAFPIRDVPNLTPQDIVDIYRRELTPKTKVLVFPHIDNLVGMRYPVRKMAEMARSSGVPFVAVDGAQAVGMIPVDLEAMGVDFYATSPHKWLQAPKGLGLLYVRRAAQKTVQPMWVTWGQSRWQNSARKFEDYGTRDLATVLALGDAIDFQQALDPAAKEKRLYTLREYFSQKCSETPGIVWHSPRHSALWSSIYTIERTGRNSNEILQQMYSVHGIVFRAFHAGDWNAMRISPNVFNTEEEIDRFFALLT